MKHFKIILVTLSLLWFALETNAQKNPTIDSIQSLLELSTKKDTFRINILRDLAWEYNYVDTKKSEEYSKQTLMLAKELNDTSWIARAYLGLGNTYYFKGDYDMALKYYQESIPLFEKIGMKTNLSSVLNNCAGLYYQINNDEKAKEIWTKLVPVLIELKDENNLEAVYNNLGNVNRDLHDFEESIKCFEKSLKISLNNGYQRSIANTYSNLGETYNQMGEYEKSLSYQDKSLKMREEFGDKNGIISSLMIQANTYRNMGISRKGLEPLKRSLSIAEEVNSNYYKQQIYWHLAQTYEDIGDFKNALDAYVEHSYYKDSLFNEESNKAIADMQTKYETEKKEKENKLLKQQNEIDKATNERQQIIIWGSVIGLILLSFVVYLLFRGNKTKQRSNELLTSQRDEIAEQKREITDSIDYAKYIQEAVLPAKEEIAKDFSESFVLFQPRDIVSGDFYWHFSSKDKIVITVADCTGHGVPGAFMSMMGAELLNQVVAHPKIKTPAQALSFMDKRIKENLNKNKSAQKRHDGMDISLCLYEPDKKLLQFSGANNPLIRIRNGILEKFNAARYGVGGMYHENSEYPLHEIKVEKGDCFYMFTDGFADQFGGPQGKKFMKKKLYDLLLQITIKTMSEQREDLLDQFIAWKGNLDQVDDVCIIGLRI